LSLSGVPQPCSGDFDERRCALLYMYLTVSIFRLLVILENLKVYGCRRFMVSIKSKRRATRFLFYLYISFLADVKKFYKKSPLKMLRRLDKPSYLYLYMAFV